MTPLRLIEPRVDFLDPRTGKISRQWYLYLQGLYSRVGGAEGLNQDDLITSAQQPVGPGDALLEDLQALRSEVMQLRAAADQASENYARIEQTLGELQAQVHELSLAVSSLQVQP